MRWAAFTKGVFQKKLRFEECLDRIQKESWRTWNHKYLYQRSDSEHRSRRTRHSGCLWRRPYPYHRGWKYEIPEKFKQKLTEGTEIIASNQWNPHFTKRNKKHHDKSSLPVGVTRIKCHVGCTHACSIATLLLWSALRLHGGMGCTMMWSVADRNPKKYAGRCQFCDGWLQYGEQFRSENFWVLIGKRRYWSARVWSCGKGWWCWSLVKWPFHSQINTG